MIPTLKPSKYPYSVALLPQWPHFYTWLLQAAGYLLLDSQKKKMMIISQQSDVNKDIIVDTSIYWPIFWQTRKTSLAKISTFARSIGGILSDKPNPLVQDAISFQLPFLRTITDTKEILHVGVGDKISKNQNKKLSTWIKNNIQDYNIILLTNIEIPPSSKSKKSDEQKQIEKLLQTWSTVLLELFHTIVANQKKKPEIIAYVNPSDFNKTWSLTTRYICAVW